MRLHLCTKSVLIVLTFVCAFVAFTKYYFTSDDPDIHAISLPPSGGQQIVATKEADPAYVILFWTKYFNQPIEWYLSDSELTIDGERCAGSP
ncbi:unnamed protein product, partial [Oppiella nova]